MGLFVRHDWSQTESATFLCESLLSSASFPFALSLPPSLTKILAFDLLRNTFSKEGDLVPCPPTGFCTLPGPSRDPPVSPASLQAGLTLEFKVLLQLLLFFKRKLGYWVRAKSTWGRAEGKGVGIDKWDPHWPQTHVCLELDFLPDMVFQRNHCQTAYLINLGCTFPNHLPYKHQAVW